MKKKKYLHLFDELIDEYNAFLCHNIDSKDEIFKLFIPNDSELIENYKDGYEYNSAWCSKRGIIDCGFNELRQTIVLFCAAINNEL